MRRNVCLFNQSFYCTHINTYFEVQYSSIVAVNMYGFPTKYFQVQYFLSEKQYVLCAFTFSEGSFPSGTVKERFGRLRWKGFGLVKPANMPR